MHELARDPTALRLSRRRAVLGVFALASLPLLLLGLVNLWREVGDGEARVADERVALARSAAFAINVLVGGDLSTLRGLALTRDLIDRSRHPDLVPILERIRERDLNWDTVGLNDQDGWNIALAGANSMLGTVNVADLEFFQETQATGQPVISSAFFGRIRGVPLIALAVPVEFAGGGRGVLAGSLSLARLREDLRALPQDGRVEIVLLDSRGQIFIHPNPEISQPLTSIRGRPDADAVLAGETGSRRVVGLDGADTLVAYAPVPDTGWGVLIQQPASAAFELVWRQLAQTLALYALAATMAGLLGWFLGGRLSALYRRAVDARLQAEATALELRAVSAESEGRRRFLERLIDSAPIAIAVLEGPEHRYVAANASYQAIKPGAQFVGRTVSEVAPEAERQGIIALLDRVYATGEQFTTVDQLVEIDDGMDSIEPRYFTFVLARYEDAEGRPEGVISISLETTEQVLARRRVDQEKDEFLSFASHELKTPLSSLGLSAQMLDRMVRRGSIDMDRLERYLGNISAQVARATLLIGDLLDVSRIQSSRLQLHQGPVDLVELTATAVQRTRDTLPEDMEHDIVQIVDNAPIVVEGDETRLDQVLTNLLSNAIKYSPAGSRVEARLAQWDGQVRLEVVDRGIGIPESERDTLFAPFSRTASARQSGVEGTGLGLYITRQIVEAHGGTIDIIETPGGGSTFVVTLPLTQQRPVEAPTRETHDAT